jgi:chaperonin GroES
VLVKVKETLTATSGGILLPDQAKERPTEGVVVCAGPGKIHPFTGRRIANPVEAGMSVLYGKFDGRPVNYNGDECQVIRDDNVLLAYAGVTMRLDNAVPVRDYVLVEVSRPASGGGGAGSDLQTSSGVVVAAQVMKDKAICEGTVAKVGEGRMASEGNLTPSPVRPGDYVKWKDYAGSEVKIEGKEYSLVKMVDILATRRKDDAADGGEGA